MFVKEAMRPDVKTINPGASIEHAAKKMKKHGIGSLMVLKNGKPEGIITEFDVSPLKERGGISVKSAMKTNLITVSPSDSLNYAVVLMLKNRIKQLPVLEEGMLVGIITESDINRYFSALQKKVKDISELRKYMGVGV